MDAAEPQERRGRRGRAERAAAQKAATAKAPQPRLPFPPVAIVSEDQLEAIHEASLTILTEIGMDFLHPEAKAILKGAGAEVEETRTACVLIEGSSKAWWGSRRTASPCMRAIAERSVTLGGNAVAFCSVASTPNAADREGGRRPGAVTDFRNLVRLGQSLDAVHLWGGYPVEPVDIHAFRAPSRRALRYADALGQADPRL